MCSLFLSLSLSLCCPLAGLAAGVGRNIAECAARLGVPVRFVSVIGADVPGHALKDSFRELNIVRPNAVPLLARVLWASGLGVFMF